MRSTVSGPVQSCSSTTLSSPKKYAAVQLLTQETLYFTVETKSRAKELFAQVCLHLGNSRGMVDAELFGLAIASDGEYLFVDPDSKLSKYAPKTWRSSHGQGLGATGCPLLVLHFRVQFYVDSPLLLRDKVTRHHYYLQLRQNAVSADRWQAGAGGAARRSGVADGGVAATASSVAAACLLAGLALQADLGDRVEDEEEARRRRREEGRGSDGEEEGTDEEVAAASESYFALSEYLPPQLERTMAVGAVAAHHRGLRGLSAPEAQLQYIREAAVASCTVPGETMTPEASSPPPLRLNLHLYRLNKSKKGPEASPGGGGSGGGGLSTPGPNTTGPNTQPVWLGICAKGIEILEENDEKAVLATFLWSNIGKLCFERKKFEIRALNWPGSTPRKFTYYSNSDEKSKHLLSLCRLTHQFSMAMQPRLAEVRRREEEERKRMRELCPLLLELSVSKGGSMGGGSHHRAALAAHALRHALFPVPAHRVHGTHGSECKGHGDQRVSVISNTSSNTTSGIVSDRVQSLDESEDDLEMEIMINSPPAPSVESLALAHLRDAEDSPLPHHVSPSPAPSLDSQDGILEGAEKGKEQEELVSPPCKTSSAPTPPTDGSQCSSSCSTVVNPSASSVSVTEPTSTTPAPTRAGSAHSSCSQRSGHSLLSLARSSTGGPPSTSPAFHGRTTAQQRHQSRSKSSPGSINPHIRTASDLSVGTCSTGSEMGFGHTAQNSMDCGSPGESGICGSGPGEGSGEGVAETAASEGGNQQETVQSLDYSVQSAHTYGCPPRRRSTVSSTLDTDSDYVRLPLCPITSMSDDSDSLVDSSPTPPPPPPRDESSGAPRMGSYVYLKPSPRSLSGMTSIGDEPDGRLMRSLRHPPPPPPPPAMSATSEANARFITTRPHISILTAHTSSAPTTAPPSFASPPSAQQQLRAYPPGDARTHPPAVHPRPPGALLPSPVITRGVTLQHHPSSPHRHLSIGSNGGADDLAAKMKPTVATPGHSPILPVIGPNNYLDVHASKVMVNHRHNHHHHQQHHKQRSALLRGTIQSPTKKSHQVSRGHPVSPVVSPLPSPLMAHQSRQQSSFLCVPPCGIAAHRHRHHHHHHHHHHAAPCLVHHAGGSPGASSPVAPQQSLATVYTNQVTQSQIEQYKQQLYSDVDYVIYPMKDPALSKQEYMDAKQGSTLMAHLQQQQYNSHHHHHHFHGAFIQQPPPPPYRSPTKSGVLYRSTPNVSGGGGSYGIHHPPHSVNNGALPFPQHRIVPAPKYASNQNLSCGGGSSASTSTNSTVNSYMSEMAPFPALRPFLSTQSLALTQASACSFYSASTQNLTCGVLDQHPTPPPPPVSMGNGGEFMQVNIPTLPALTGHLEFGRTRSDDNILNIDKHHGTITGRKFYRLPPPPPYDPSVNSAVNGTPLPETSPPLVAAPQPSPSSSSSEEAKKADDGMLDIRTLREKSKNLDLPLISALCNDRSLLKQTNAFVAQHHPGHREGEGAAYQGEPDHRGFGGGRPVSWHVESRSAGEEGRLTTGALASLPPAAQDQLQKPRVMTRGHPPDLKGPLTSNGGGGSGSAFGKSSKHSYSVSPSKKYPVSGLSTTQISKPQRKVSSCTHTHPQDPRVPLMPGTTSLAATASGTSIVLASLKGTVGNSKSRIGLKQKSSVVP